MEGVKETGGNKTKKTRRRGGGEDETIAGTKDSSSSAESSPSSLSSTATEFVDCCDFRSGMDATTFALSISICRSFPISSPPNYFARNFVLEKCLPVFLPRCPPYHHNNARCNSKFSDEKL